MRKFFLTLMASLLSCSAASAFWPEAAESSLEIGVGYRNDRLEWRTKNHSDDSDTYDYDCYNLPLLGVRSHLKWRNLHIWQIEAKGKYVTCDNIYLRANGDYGWIVHGKNTDRDSTSGYCSDDSSFEFSHSRAKVRGHVYDARLAVGYQFRWCDDSFAVAPLFGYSWHGQHLHDRHKNGGDYCSSNSFSYDGYNDHKQKARYHTRWNGPFLGLDFDWRFGCCCEWDLFGAYEFHWAHYHARGHWNLRPDLFDGFRHHSKDAFGHIFDIGIRMDFCECWYLALKGEFQWWWADKGHDRAKNFHRSCGDASEVCRIRVPLRHVRWHSAGVSLDIGMLF